MWIRGLDQGHGSIPVPGAPNFPAALFGYFIPWCRIHPGYSIAAVAKKSPQHAYSPPLVALGEAIRHFRVQSGLSQEALALEAEIDRSYLGGIERGEHNVAVMNLVKLAQALGVSLARLMQQARL